MILFIYHIVSTIAALLLIPFIPIFFHFFDKIKNGFFERAGFYRDKEDKLKRKKGIRIWVHAVSVGETISAIPFINAAQKRYPDAEWVFSTVTATGQKVAREKIKDVIETIYLPFDNIFITEKSVSVVKPDIYISFESEFWPALFHSLGRRKIPILIFNGRITDKSFNGYLKYRFFFKEVFKYVSFFGMQSIDDADKMKTLVKDLENIKYTGNLKYAMEIEESKNFPDFPDGLYFIAGSTHEGEDEIVLEAFKRLRRKYPSLKLVIAPRHPERFDSVYELCSCSGFKVDRRSLLANLSSFEGDILLLDIIGELRFFYRFGRINFLGGSLVPAGGHNMLEVAYWGKPSIFGSYLSNFRDISEEFIRCKGGFIVSGIDDIVMLGTRLIEDDQFFESSGENAKKVFDLKVKVLEENLQILDLYIGKVKR